MSVNLESQMKSDTSADLRVEARRMTAAIDGDKTVEACLTRIEKYSPQDVVALSERGADRTARRVRDGMAEVARRYRSSMP
jgi:hypothetical protein